MLRTLRAPQGSIVTCEEALAETLLGLGWTEVGRYADTTEPEPAPEAETADEPEGEGADTTAPEAETPRPKSRRR